MDIRPLALGDEDAALEIVNATWNGDPMMAALHGIHGQPFDAPGRWRRSVVAIEDGVIVGAGTVSFTERHPTRLGLVINVADCVRRRGIGSSIYRSLDGLRGDRSFLARTRPDDREGLAFLEAHGFGVLTRNEVSLINPQAPWNVKWRAEALARASRVGVNVSSASDRDHPLATEEIARAHESVYRHTHSSWAPVGDLSSDASRALFCGDPWIADGTSVAYRDDEIVGVASLYGRPLAERDDELYLVFAGVLKSNTAHADEIVAALAARSAQVASERVKDLRIEADEADSSLWRVLRELERRESQNLLLLANDPDFRGS
jgi:hypothetical protein